MISFNKNQIYIVTGASSGLGKATALLLNELGATVVAIARNKNNLQKAKKEATNPENFHIEIKDLIDDINDLPAYVKALKNKYGKFSGMAYCAGISGLCPEMAMTYDYALNVFNSNYFAPLLFMKGIGDRRNNVGQGTSVVFISSIDAKANNKGQSLYGGSKAALCASFKAISKEYASLKVRINCVLPSMIKTAMTEDVMSQGYAVNESLNYPFGYGEPNDVANLIVFLLSEKAKFISGQNYIIDSGGVL